MVSSKSSSLQFFRLCNTVMTVDLFVVAAVAVAVAAAAVAVVVPVIVAFSKSVKL